MSKLEDTDIRGINANELFNQLTREQAISLAKKEEKTCGTCKVCYGFSSCDTCIRNPSLKDNWQSREEQK